jgi:LPS export ABC transporter protein LptC
MRGRLGLLALMCLGLALMSTACERAPLASGSVADTDGASLSFNGFKVRASHEGKLVWEAEAVRAKVYQQVNRAEAEEVTLTYYQNGRRVSQVQADKADMDLKTYDVKARGDVRVKGTNGVSLTTSQLDWDNVKQLATSQARVRVERKGTVLTGLGLHADRALKDVQILEDVQAEAASVGVLQHEGDGWKH